MANTITQLITWLRGEQVGTDSLGNIYYQERKPRQGARRRRWVVYADGIDEASRVPPMNHAWLHYTIDQFPEAESRQTYGWERDHLPNQTGTGSAYRPPGHVLAGGQRDRATGDYDAWTPPNSRSE